MMDKYEIYRKAIDHLENVAGFFEQELGTPVPEHGAFIFESPSVKHICFLKGIRIVSGLNALLALLQAGYVTEMGVIIRTIGDCINDVYFLLEHYPETTPEVEKYVSNFFDEIIEEPAISEDERRKTYRTKVKKIHASRARLLSERMNFPVDRDMVYRVYSAYSGYVHAAYPNIMELYDNGEPNKFHLRGLKGTSRIENWETIFTSLIRSVILVFGFMAEKYEKTELIQDIRIVLDWFEGEIMQAKPES